MDIFLLTSLRACLKGPPRNLRRIAHGVEIAEACHELDGNYFEIERQIKAIFKLYHRERQFRKRSR